MKNLLLILLCTCFLFGCSNDDDDMQEEGNNENPTAAYPYAIDESTWFADFETVTGMVEVTKKELGFTTGYEEIPGAILLSYELFPDGTAKFSTNSNNSTGYWGVKGNGFYWSGDSCGPPESDADLNANCWERLEFIEKVGDDYLFKNQELLQIERWTLRFD